MAKQDHGGRRLDAVDLTSTLAREEAEERLERAQLRLLHLRLVCGGLLGDHGRLGPPLCVVFEGWDAAGKGGAIKRLVARLDPRHVQIGQYAAPSSEEARHHFLWRFFPNLPGAGELSIFDRSWYGRVLVERVEGSVDAEACARAYREIRFFEEALVEEGGVVVKFWLHLSPEEQLRRFEARQRDPLKRWKISDEDWRNRGQRSLYEAAVEDMLAATDHRWAPWEVVAAEHKGYARVTVAETVVARLEAGMLAAGFDIPPSKGLVYD
jgi:AMP-polyphosphate phosphotransferase